VTAPPPGINRKTVRSETWIPSFRSSPCTRGAPQSGLAAAIPALMRSERTDPDPATSDAVHSVSRRPAVGARPSSPKRPADGPPRSRQIKRNPEMNALSIRPYCRAITSLNQSVGRRVGFGEGQLEFVDVPLTGGDHGVERSRRDGTAQFPSPKPKSPRGVKSDAHRP
jgi:hypothetical protein